MSLKNIQNLIIDEADKLFELDFVEQIDEIIDQCPETAQKALFSATISKNVEILAENLLNDYISVVVGEKNTVSELVEQKLVFVGQEEGKLLALRQMFQNGFKPPILIFVDNIERAKMLFRELVYDGINVDVIHSQRTQAQREKVISNFRAGKIWVLIATDLMGRGIDFKGVNVVINYDFPHTVASYIHRIGRAGRASRKGSSITYFLREDREKLKKIIPLLPKDQVPKWISGNSE